MKKTIIVKIGSSTLTKDTDQISRGKIEDLARQIKALQSDYNIVIVSSGAIATAKQFIELSGGSPIAVKQALAAIGQPLLIRIYQEVFGDFGLKVAQCLMHYQDFGIEKSSANIVNTIQLLLDNGYIPIINENDTVATEEILFGDNDKLAAMTAALIKADLLILASNVNGLFDGRPDDPNATLIKEVTDIDAVEKLVSDMISNHGTGGMSSKLQAARICQKADVEMWIVNGGPDGFLKDSLSGEIEFTKFV
jgi:glutamate 5-kinase